MSKDLDCNCSERDNWTVWCIECKKHTSASDSLPHCITHCCKRFRDMTDVCIEPVDKEPPPPEDPPHLKSVERRVKQ